MAEFFSGRVVAVTFANTESAFYIVKMKLDREDGEEGATVTVRGNIPAIPIQVGSWFGFQGTWQSHKQWGDQLVVKKAPILKNGLDSEAVTKLLLAQGLNPKILLILKNHFGDALVPALSNLDTLQEAPTVTRFNAIFIKTKWDEIVSWFATVDLFEGLGIPKNIVTKVQTKFGSATAELIKTNPWKAIQVDGFTLDHADAAALKFGLDLTDFNRVLGAVLHAVKNQKGMGHLYCSSGEVLESVQKLCPSSTTHDIASAIKLLNSEKHIVIDTIPETSSRAIYEPWFHHVESYTAEKLVSRMGTAKLSSEKEAGYIKKLSTIGPKTSQAASLPNATLREVAEAAVSEWCGMTSLNLSPDQQEGVVNAIVEPVSVLTGLPGSGKCVVTDTLISGPGGFFEIGDILPKDLPSNTDRELVIPLDTSKGIKNSAYVYNGGFTKIIKLETACGYTLEGTPEHPIRIIRDSKIVWEKLTNLKVGDVPVLLRGGKYSFGKLCKLPTISREGTREIVRTTPEYMTEGLAKIIGYLISEGSVVDEKTWAITTFDSKILDFLIKEFDSQFNFKLNPKNDKRQNHPVGISFGSTFLIRWFRELGVTSSYAGQKEIPHCILKSTKSMQVSFLQALFEGDGCVDPGRLTIEYGTKSLKLSKQLQFILLSMGIVSNRFSCVRGGFPYYRIGIYGEDYSLFRELVGFHYTTLPPQNKKLNTNKHVVYNIEESLLKAMQAVKPKKGSDYNKFYRYTSLARGVAKRKPSRTRLFSLMAFPNFPSDIREVLTPLIDPAYFYDPIKVISSGEAQVVDFGVPEVHEFISNGFISHNTTSLKLAVKVLQDAGVSFLLIAPTGIAAKRISAVTGAPASTVHRAFGAKNAGKDGESREAGYTGFLSETSTTISSDGSDESWGYSENNPHPAEVVFVDESSMIDQSLLYRLVSCTSPTCRLVFIGDAAQLPSVGPGNVLRNLIESKIFPVTNLVDIFRQQDTSGIILAAHAVHRGDVPDFKNNKDFVFLPIDYEDEVLSAILKLSEKFYNTRQNFQVISSRHMGTLGVTNLNLKLRELLNPGQEGLTEMKFGDWNIREGDRVMVVKNNYKLEIYNGDIGKISKIDKKSREVEIKIFGPPVVTVRMSFSDIISHLRLAYGTTIHKCVHPDTLVNVDGGLMPISRIPNEGNIETPFGMRNYRNKVSNPEAPALKIITKDGYSVTTTPDHGIDVWDGNSFIRAETQTLKEGDFLRVRLGASFAGNPQTSKLPEPPITNIRAKIHPLPTEISSELAEFFGIMVADGTIFHSGFRMAKRHIEDTDRFKYLVEKLFKASTEYSFKNNAHHIDVSSTQLSSWLLSVGGMSPNNKAVPPCILSNSSEIHRSFLKGLFLDSSVHLRSDGSLDHIELYSSSRVLLDHVRVMLLGLNIISGVINKKNGISAVAIYGENCLIFKDKIGYTVPFKFNRLNAPVGPQTRYLIPLAHSEITLLCGSLRGFVHPSTLGNIKNRKTLSRGTALNIIKDFPDNDKLISLLKGKLEWHYTIISKIETITAPSMCVEVPEEHQFIQNGFSGWNCQGLEFDNVIMPFVDSFAHQLQRNLFYTAITRAKTRVIIVGHASAIHRAVGNNRESYRNTLFIDRLLKQSAIKAEQLTTSEESSKLLLQA